MFGLTFIFIFNDGMLECLGATPLTRILFRILDGLSWYGLFLVSATMV